MKSPFIEELRLFLNLQRKLVGEFYLVEKEKGWFELEGEIWDFYSHGAGVLFQSRRSKKTIDVHENIDEPDVFDAWRLRTYFGSIGRKGVKIVEKCSGKKKFSLDRGLQIILQELININIIIPYKNGYKLNANGGA